MSASNPMQLAVWSHDSQAGRWGDDDPTQELVDEVVALREALRANVMARRNAPGGCCDWSCALCAPLAERET